MIVLTARGEVEDRVMGLDAGAVDDLVKPVSLAELVARMRVQPRLAAQVTTGTLRSGDIEVNLFTRQVRHHGRVLSREQILSAVWGVVDVYIGYLRRKLNLPDNPAPIFTVRTVGYRVGDAA